MTITLPRYNNSQIRDHKKKYLTELENYGIDGIRRVITDIR